MGECEVSKTTCRTTLIRVAEEVDGIVDRCSGDNVRIMNLTDDGLHLTLIASHCVVNT